MSASRNLVNVQDAKTHLSRLLKQVEAGDEVVIARAGKAIAKLVRVEQAAPRAWGAFEGQVRVAADCWAPLTPDEAEAWGAAELDP